MQIFCFPYAVQFPIRIQQPVFPDVIIIRRYKEPVPIRTDGDNTLKSLLGSRFVILDRIPHIHFPVGQRGRFLPFRDEIGRQRLIYHHKAAVFGTQPHRRVTGRTVGCRHGKQDGTVAQITGSEIFSVSSAQTDVPSCPQIPVVIADSPFPAERIKGPVDGEEDVPSIRIDCQQLRRPVFFIVVQGGRTEPSGRRTGRVQGHSGEVISYKVQHLSKRQNMISPHSYPVCCIRYRHRPQKSPVPAVQIDPFLRFFFRVGSDQFSAAAEQAFLTGRHCGLLRMSHAADSPKGILYSLPVQQVFHADGCRARAKARNFKAGCMNTRHFTYIILLPAFFKTPDPFRDFVILRDPFFR